MAEEKEQLEYEDEEEEQEEEGDDEAPDEDDGNVYLTFFLWCSRVISILLLLRPC